jgi:threonine dehydrogenase-like Zn-dependent dehydrogenase
VNPDPKTLMLAADLSQGRARVTQKPIPAPAPGEALIRTLLAGICATDLELTRGYAQFTGTPGHEFVGEVIRADGAPGLIGHRVVADINCGCGVCPACLHQDPRHCPDRKVLGIRGREGAFAEYLTVPTENLHSVPDRVDTLEAVFAEPLAAALEITQQLHIKHSTRIGILGGGKLGILMALGLNHFSSQVTLIGRRPSLLDLASRKGVRTELTDSVNLETAGFDLVVDATGHPRGLSTALELVRPEGTVVLKTTAQGTADLDLTPIAVREISLIGSRCGDLSLALKFLDQGWITVDDLVEAVYPLQDFPKALEHASRPGTLKVLVAFDREDP